MIQYKVFVGTIAELEQAFNAWAASLVPGANVNTGPLTPMIPGSVEDAADRQWFKEVMYVLPVRGNGIAVPAPAIHRGA